MASQLSSNPRRSVHVAVGVAIAMALAAAYVVTASGSAGGGVVRSANGPRDCRSFDSVPVQTSSAESTTVVSVSGWIKCDSSHGNLVAGISVWERRGSEAWRKVGSARFGSINSREARGAASSRCRHSDRQRMFEVSMWSKVDGSARVFVRRSSGQRLAAKIMCLS